MIDAVRRIASTRRTRLGTTAGLLLALVLFAIGTTGAWLEYRVRVSCGCCGCGRYLVQDPIATKSLSSLAPIQIAGLLLLVLIASLIVFGGYEKFGIVTVPIGLFLARQPFRLSDRIVVQQFLDGQIYYRPVLTQTAWYFIYGALLLIALGGYLFSRWIKRRVAPATDPRPE